MKLSNLLDRPRLVIRSLELAAPAVLVTWWWFASQNSGSPFFPPLSEILSDFRQYWLGERLLSDLSPSLKRMLGGFLLASLLGSTVGLLLGLSGSVRHILDPLVTFLRSIPAAALIPMAIVALGLGDTMKISVVAFVCVWPVLLNAMDAVDDRDPEMVATSCAYRIGRIRAFWHITLPGAAPRISSGMRTSLSLAIAVTLISEMVASTNGVGAFTIRAQRQFDSAAMWSAIILLGLLGYLLNLAYSALERLVLRWHFESKEVT